MIAGLIVLVLAALALMKLGALKVWVLVLGTIIKVIVGIALLVGVYFGMRYLVRRFKKYKAKAKVSE